MIENNKFDKFNAAVCFFFLSGRSINQNLINLLKTMEIDECFFSLWKSYIFSMMTLGLCEHHRDGLNAIKMERCSAMCEKKTKQAYPVFVNEF